MIDESPTQQDLADAAKILRLAVQEAKSGSIIPIRAAALRLGMWGTPASRLAIDSAQALVSERWGQKPTHDEWIKTLEIAARRLEEKL